jgi:hypothetical protein
VSDPEPDPGFTFVDRRRRGEEAPAGDAPPSRPSAPSRPSPPPPRPASPVEPAPARGQPRADFASFCMMLYGDALVHLGRVPDPVSGRPHVDLEQAQFTIDLLTVLKEKTEGNRTSEESTVLDEILATLRMAFVHASRRA